MKRFVSMLLMFAVLMSLAVPCELTAFAEDESAGDGIYACLYKIDPTKGPGENNGNLELVFKNNDTSWDATRKYGKDIFTRTRTSVTLRYVIPEIAKTASPQSGTSEIPETVVKGRTINYTLTVTNPDPEVPLTDVVLEDRFPLVLAPNGADAMVCFNGGEEHSIENANARITYVTNRDEGTNELVFTATVKNLEPNENVAITIPVTVSRTLEKGYRIENKAKVLSVNGVTLSNVESNTTYHVVSEIQAKILKVNTNGDRLEHAKLQIYENNDTNWDAEHKTITLDAQPMTLDDGEGNPITTFESTKEILRFDVPAGSYILHENQVPDDEFYKYAADIPFTIDVEGVIRVGGKVVDYVEMVDEPSYSVIFHENKPGGSKDDKEAKFRVYGPAEIKPLEYHITHFYDIPDWAGDEYVFAGWYHNADYSEQTYDENGVLTNGDSIDTPAIFDDPATEAFEGDTYPKPDPVHDYHLYGKWIKVDTVEKDDKDVNNYVGSIRGFGLAGVQIRDPFMYDSNYSGETPQGMRFITTLSERLLSEIDAVSERPVETPEGNVNVEYGYAVATEENLAKFIDGVGNKWESPISGQYEGVNLSKYKLRYNGRNVNGVDTTGLDERGNRFKIENGVRKLARDDLSAENDYAYVKNINCTRGISITGENGDPTGTIIDDHRNFDNYRLYTFVVTYEKSADKTDKKVVARSYIRYYDANGWLRVFYNDYKKNMYYGGCLCSFKQVSGIALSKQSQQAEPAQETGD